MEESRQPPHLHMKDGAYPKSNIEDDHLLQHRGTPDAGQRPGLGGACQLQLGLLHRKNYGVYSPPLAVATAAEAPPHVACTHSPSSGLATNMFAFPT